jgi:hypothetical protein
MPTRLNTFRTAHNSECDEGRCQKNYCIDPASHFSSKGVDLIPKLQTFRCCPVLVETA